MSTHQDQTKEALKTVVLPNQTQEAHPPSTSESPSDRWYLGIDIGTSGISAALLHYGSRCIYPIYWEPITKPSTAHPSNRPSPEQFRLPAIASLSVPPGITSESATITIESVADVGIQEQFQPQKRIGKNDGFPSNASKLLLQNFKSLLNITLPYIGHPKLRVAGESETLQNILHEPAIQWSNTQTIPLVSIQQVLQALLETLKPPSSSHLCCQAVGLKSTVIQTALENLQGVIVGCPANSADAYRINVREAILGAGLVQSPEQVFVIEDAIATLLAKLSLDVNSEQWENIHPTVMNLSRTRPQFGEGGTLIINVGATSTELALVDLPSSLKYLTHSDFSCQTFPYGGNALDQDIICQLLLDPIHLEDWRQPGDPELPKFPQPGTPDLATRYQFQQWLQSSPWGVALLTAIPQLKITLQTQEETPFILGERQWTLTRQTLERRVLVPFVQELNRHLNSLFSQVGMSPVGINQAICTGGGGAWLALGRWLRQKLPNAIILQEPTQLAWGLASLPLYPQVLDVANQQYNDYFLLAELLTVIGIESLSMSQITQGLENRGINTHACYGRLVRLLSGTLPPGFIPASSEVGRLTTQSQQNTDYQTLTQVPIFSESSHLYSLVPESTDCVIRYLEKLNIGRHQKLQEPLCQSFN